MIYNITTRLYLNINKTHKTVLKIAHRNRRDRAVPMVFAGTRENSPLLCYPGHIALLSLVTVVTLLCGGSSVCAFCLLQLLVFILVVCTRLNATRKTKRRSL